MPLRVKLVAQPGLRLEVRDAGSNAVVSGAEVEILQRGVRMGEWRTDAAGLCLMELDPVECCVRIRHPDYESAEIVGVLIRQEGFSRMTVVLDAVVTTVDTIVEAPIVLSGPEERPSTRFDANTIEAWDSTQRAKALEALSVWSKLMEEERRKREAEEKQAEERK